MDYLIDKMLVTTETQEFTVGIHGDHCIILSTFVCVFEIFHDKNFKNI